MSGLEGLEELTLRLKKMDKALTKAATKGARQGASEIAKNAKKRAPVDTGELRNSIKVDARADGDDIIGAVTVGAEHGAYVEFGTGPMGEYMENGFGPMAPVNVTHRTKGWVYTNPKTGERVFTLGNFARPFLYPAFLESREKAEELVAQALREVLKEGGG